MQALRSIQPIGRTLSGVATRRAFHVAQPRLTGKTVEATVDSFEQLVTKADHPVIVDFYAKWCGPCKVLTPILTKTVAANPNVTLVKVNVDDMMDISSKYKIAALPTVKAFHNSEVVDEFVGMRNVAQCQEFVKKHAERAK